MSEQNKNNKNQSSESPLDFFLSKLNEEYQQEKENNPILKFKSKLRSATKKLDYSANPFLKNEENLNSIQEDIQEIPEQESPEQIDIVSYYSENISKEQASKPIKETTNLFSVPDIDSVKSLQDKLKYLEQWVYKISAAGPGGGEVNFRWLDDVNRSTIGNTDQILRYNPSDKKFFFGQLSGDQGPIQSLNFANTGAGIVQTPGTLDWNSEKDCLNVYQNDESTLQVGLENYIRVHNSTANTLTNGTVVMFSGVNGDGETPTCVPLIADSTAVPLYTIGVLTNDISANTTGRATNLGEVRNIDTTGNDVGESWVVGDLLWANPSHPGKLTKVKPTAPNVVISIAAVVKSSNASGVLLVRPILFPRLYYGSFFDTTDQIATANTLNTPIAVKYSNTQISSGFHIANTSQIVAENSGLYNYQFSIQIDSTTASTSQNIWIWYRKNGNDVPSTTTRLTVDKDYKVAAWNFIESMNAGDNFQLMWATDSVHVKIVAPPATAFCPSIPSVIMTVTQVNL